MKRNLHARRDGFLVASIDFEPGQVWDVPNAEGIDLGDGTRDTSNHACIYVSGTFLTKYEQRAPFVIEGRAFRGAQPITGRKDRHPTGPFTVTCINGGRGLFILRRGENRADPLDFEILGEGEQFSVPKAGYAVWYEGESAYEMLDVPAGTLVAPVRGVVFWNR